MYPPRILTVDSRVWAHLGVNMWSRRPWSSGWDAVVASLQRAPTFSLSFGLISGEVQGTHLATRWVVYLLSVCQVALGPRRWASVLDSIYWGIFVGQFCRRGSFILGAGLLPWVDGQFCGSSGGFVGIFMGG